MEYFDKYLIYTDSIKEIINTETIRKMQSLYNYQLKEEKNRELQQENKRQELWLTILISTIMLSITLIIIYQQYNKRKKQKIQEQQRLLDEHKENNFMKASNI